jgi:homoserine dehydrogenase
VPGDLTKSVRTNSSMELQLAFIGFGNVARAFARLLVDNRSEHEIKYGVRWKATAIATARHGCITSTAGIDLLKASVCVERGDNLTELPESLYAADAISVIKSCNADILFETSPLNAIDGEPATTHIKTALERGINVITANKGPIAFAYSALKARASQHHASFRFEGTVMDGAPVFNMVDACLPGVGVFGFSGVLNSTTNLVLTGMESGRSFEDSLAEAKRRGIAEANSDYDIDGWDAAVKAVALANVIMGAEVRPVDVARQGIRSVRVEDLEEAARSGMTIRLVARGKRIADKVTLTVAPEMVPLSSALGSVRGTSNVLLLETDLMGQIGIVEEEPGVDQTAYALFSDMLQIHSRLNC